MADRRRDNPHIVQVLVSDSVHLPDLERHRTGAALTPHLRTYPGVESALVTIGAELFAIS